MELVTGARAIRQPIYSRRHREVEYLGEFLKHLPGRRPGMMYPEKLGLVEKPGERQETGAAFEE
jgi:hypothetical protein